MLFDLESFDPRSDNFFLSKRGGRNRAALKSAARGLAMRLRRIRPRTILPLIAAAAALCVPRALNAQAQTAAQAPPKIIEGCFSETLAKLGGPCEYWIRIGDSDNYNVVPPGTSGETATGHLVHFDRNRIEATVTYQMNKGPSDNPPKNYTGTIKGNKIDGGVIQMIKLPPGAQYNPKPIPWTGWIFSPPAKSAHSAQAAFVSCGQKMSAVNTGDHTVVTTDLKLNEFQFPQSMTVSADGKTAYASTNGQRADFYPAKLLVVDAEQGLTRTMDLKNSVPIGFSSMAIAGDGVTLYGVEMNADASISFLIAMDAGTGNILAKIPYKPKDQYNPRASLVMAGNKVVLDDGTIPGLPAPRGGVAVFGSDGKGLTAFPDGLHLCAVGKTITIGDPAAAKPPCSGLSGATTLVAPGPVGRTGPVSILGRFRTADQMLPGTKGITPDGSSLFVTFPPTSNVVFFGTDKLAVADRDNLITDVVQICDKPNLLAMPPPAP